MVGVHPPTKVHCSREGFVLQGNFTALSPPLPSPRLAFQAAQGNKRYPMYTSNNMLLGVVVFCVLIDSVAGERKHKFEDIWQYILTPFITMGIGYGTNMVAVKMLFHPQEEKRFLCIKIQGIFPKRQNTLAEKVGETVSTKLLRHQDIREYMLKDQFQVWIVDSRDIFVFYAFFKVRRTARRLHFQPFSFFNFRLRCVLVRFNYSFSLDGYAPRHCRHPLFRGAHTR